MQGARTLWYHDHGVHRTAHNAYAGLAAQYHLHDDMEAASGIPTGAYDAPLIIRDALFAQDGVAAWDDNDQSSFMGDVILVNGVPWPVMPVQKRRYRFRILNAVDLALVQPLAQRRAREDVGDRDGRRLHAQAGAGRRACASAWPSATRSSSTSPAASTTPRCCCAAATVKNNVDYLHTRKIMKFKVGAGQGDRPLAQRDPGVVLHPGRAARRAADYIGPGRGDGPHGEHGRQAPHVRVQARATPTGMWTIDGETWDDVVAQRLQATCSPTPRPTRSRSGTSRTTRAAGSTRSTSTSSTSRSSAATAGRRFAYEQGPKDVAYVGEGETVRVVAKFGPHEGRYMIHCHNLVHEDHDMMSQFRVGPKKEHDPNDPINGDPAGRAAAMSTIATGRAPRGLADGVRRRLAAGLRRRPLAVGGDRALRRRRAALRGVVGARAVLRRVRRAPGAVRGARPVARRGRGSRWPASPAPGDRRHVRLLAHERLAGRAARGRARGAGPVRHDHDGGRARARRRAHAHARRAGAALGDAARAARGGRRCGPPRRPGSWCERRAAGHPRRPRCARRGAGGRGRRWTAAWLPAPARAAARRRLLVAEPFRIPSDEHERRRSRRGDHVSRTSSPTASAPRSRATSRCSRRPDGAVLAKRIVALGGQRVEIRDGVLFVDRRRGASPTSTTRAWTASSSARPAPDGRRVRARRQPRRLGGLARLRRDPARPPDRPRRPPHPAAGRLLGVGGRRPCARGGARRRQLTLRRVPAAAAP